MLHICTKICQSISKGFRDTDLDSRVDTRVVANIDGRTNVCKTRSLYRLRQVQQESKQSCDNNAKATSIDPDQIASKSSLIRIYTCIYLIQI